MAKTNKLILSVNAGELSPEMDSRIDQAKYLAGCRTMENFIPRIYGGAERRPGTQYIAAQKTSSAKGRVVAFEHSVDDTYILLFENQVIRVFRNGAQVTTGSGTETLSVDNIIGHWLLNDNEASTTVLDDDGSTHNGTASANTDSLHADGKVGTGCFDFNGAYCVEMSDHNDFSFTDNSNDTAFSMGCWAYITKNSDIQVLLSKWRNSGTTREWRFSLDADRKLQLHLADTSAGLTSNLVAHWYLNDDAANTAVDDAVAAVPHDGVASSNTEDLTTTGKVGACFDFAGTASVYVNDHAALSFDDSGTAPFSVAAWVYVTDHTASQIIFAKHDTGGKREYALYLLNDGTMGVSLYDESASAVAKRITDSPLASGWRFVAMTYVGTGGATAAAGITLYVDGAEVSSTASYIGTYVAMENDTAKVSIGAWYVAASLTTNFQDKIDNVALFNKELNSSEINTLWNAGRGTETVVGVTVNSKTDSAVSLGWHYLAVTYSAPADESTAATGITFYVDGSAVDATATNNASYTAMQNGAEECRIGAQRNSADSANEKFFNDKMDSVFITSDVMSAAEIAALYTSTAYEISSPYLTADLFALKFEHSADVMYITHPSYEARKLSRLGHIAWTLEALDIQTGPFRTENSTTSATITPSATTGTITLTASGCTPFDPDHAPNGSAATDKAQTGALFKLVHALSSDSIDDVLTDNYTDDDTLHTSITSELAVYKGVTWDFTTNGTWTGTVKLEREYGNSGVWETVHTVVGVDNKNAEASGTEEFADAKYRIKMHESGDAAENCEVQFSVRDTSHIGIVEIVSVESSISATATVLATLGNTAATHRWSEGSFSNYRGWPIDAVISPEERLTFAGNISEPLTTWSSVVDDWTDFKEGTLSTDAVPVTLIGSGQQNRIRWALSKNSLIFGTVGGEHLLGASDDEEALTPTNAKAKLQTTLGSEDIAAMIVNQAILFVQRGGRKIREFVYNFEDNAYKADDLTVFSNHITESGIVDMAFQRVPDPTLWCIRDDGEIACMVYERDQDVYSWYRVVTHTNLAGTYSDSDFESVAIIYGGAGAEDEVWVTVRRTIADADARYVERFYPRAMQSDLDDMKYVDSCITYDSTATTSVTAAHLKGQTVQVLGDGAVQDTAVANASTGVVTITSASTVQVGIGYDSTLKPMKLDLFNLGLATTKKISRAIINLYNTISGTIGTTTTNQQAISTGTSALFAGEKEIPMPGGYSRTGDIIVQQTDPLPMTVLSFTLDVGAAND